MNQIFPEIVQYINTKNKLWEILQKNWKNN